MVLNNTIYIGSNSATEGKKGYLSKHEKSLKSPFLNVLHNHLPNNKPALVDELEKDESELSVSDNIELSSAVISASNIGDSDTGGLSGGSANDSPDGSADD